MTMTLLLWSGGLDSTHLLHHYLTKHKPQKHKIRTIAINHPNLAASDQQLLARQAITKELNNKGHHWPHLELTITHNILNVPLEQPDPTENPHDPNWENYQAQGPGTKGGIVHPLLWIPHAAIYLKDDENLAIAYIKSDDAQYYIRQITKTLKILNKIAGKTGKLITPLRDTHKTQIIHQLQQTELYQHTWYCENPLPTTPLTPATQQQEPCGKCAPCITHKTALWQLQTGNHYNFINKHHKNTDDEEKADDEMAEIAEHCS